MASKKSPSGVLKRKEKLLVCVAGNESSPMAVRLACKKAGKHGMGVDILTVIEPMEFQPLFGRSDNFTDERRGNAEDLLQKLSDIAQEYGITPTLHLREGKLGEQILSAVMEDSDVNMLVIGLSAGSTTGPRLVAWLAERMSDDLLVPLLLVPDNLTDQQLEVLA